MSALQEISLEKSELQLLYFVTSYLRINNRGIHLCELLHGFSQVLHILAVLLPQTLHLFVVALHLLL